MRRVAILPVVNASRYAGIEELVRIATFQLLQQSQLFVVQVAAYNLTGFTANDLDKAYDDIYGENSDPLFFVYLDDASVSTFIFDPLWPNHFIVSARPLTDPTGGSLPINQVIESTLQLSLTDVLTNYSKGQFTLLPGAEENNELVALEEAEAAHQRAEESRLYFRKLAQVQDRPYYVGLNVGMSRFAAEGTSASTVDFGGFAGKKLSQKFAVEIDLDIFSYLLANANVRYQFPLSEHYVYFAFSAGPAMVLGTISENRGFDSTNISSGQFLFGPGFSFEIPLLGVVLRGDTKLLFGGGGSVFIGTYGISYTI
ncbi:MAG: hypothetical protein HY537_08990 [Deltaproteobacteria bacterium]|nr:hypothetical protein [Deltaproteobacteria bacterium]